MSKARLIITALFTEGQSPSEVARRYGVHRSWVHKLKARYETEGEAALQPRSRRPDSSPRATSQATVDLVLRLRKQLAETGLDAGADTIGWHLAHRHSIRLSRATINRILTRAGQVTPQPAKRPKASYIRFQAELPNECWQADFHPLPARRRNRGRDPVLPRRLLPLRALRDRPQPGDRPDRGDRLPRRPY